MERENIKDIISLLTREYGDRQWRQHQSPISVLVKTILSQNTSDRNSERAFASLLAAFPNWEEVTSAKLNHITDTIRSGGLGAVKAKYIKQALTGLQQRQASFELDFLRKVPLEEARDWLRQLPGVGMKTASCVLLFGLGMPAFPVDTHVFRVVRRLGLVESQASIEQAHKKLESIVRPEYVYRAHVLLIEHGRKICRARNPLCHKCVLRESCHSYDGLSKEY